MYSCNTFYQFADQVYVPSQSYINKLSRAGLDLQRLKIFPRGIDVDQYKPLALNQSHQHLEQGSQLNGDFTLLFAGRISEDKNLDLLIEICELANQKARGRYNMVFAGDGPYLNILKAKMSALDNVYFTGRLTTQELVHWYQLSDLFVFPGHTDTFGMVVLEAQACGTPCLVTKSGGPKEIIEDNSTGRVIEADDCELWFEAIESYFNLKTNQFEQYREVTLTCRNRVLENNGWQQIFDSIIGPTCQISPSLQTDTQQQHFIENYD